VVPCCNQVSVGISFDVVNVVDKAKKQEADRVSTALAPQFGPRRGFYVGVAQRK
jgi:hypothetical protein